MSGESTGRSATSKEDLLRRAAETCVHHAHGVRPELAEVLDYLRLYYRHVAVEDLISRDPADIWGPATFHRQLGEDRPQGRANVRAFTPTVDDQGWDSGHSVVQVVTDDMPFLVDSVTMELNRHELSTHLIVHPQLKICRDVTGRLQGLGDGDGLVLEESWIHLEIDRQTDRAVLADLEKDLQRVLNDVRAAVEEEPKMRSRARTIAADLGERRPPLPVEEAEANDGIELLDWLADDHFTFLGDRAYGLGAGRRGRTASCCAPCPAPAGASCARTSPSRRVSPPCRWRCVPRPTSRTC